MYVVYIILADTLGARVQYTCVCVCVCVEGGGGGGVHTGFQVLGGRKLQGSVLMWTAYSTGGRGLGGGVWGEGSAGMTPHML